MEYLRGWRALRNDPEWIGKLTVASVIVLSGMCIPVVGQIVLIGWTSLMLRRAVSGQDSPLPRLDFDFDYLIKLINVGFKGFLSRLLWVMPLMVYVFASMCCMYIAAIAASASAVAGAASGSEVGAGVGGLGGICAMLAFCIIYPVGLFGLQMPMHVAMLRAELTDDINAGMRFREVMHMTKLMWKEIATGMLVLALLGMVAGLVGVFTLYLGLFPAIVVMNIISTYWHAELYKAYLQKGGEPLPVGPLTIEGGDVPNVGAPPGGNYPPQQF